MAHNLWSINTPQKFWQLQPGFQDDLWDRAIKNSITKLNLPPIVQSIDDVLEYTLGEARFGSDRYRIGKLKRIYYLIKPVLPRWLIYRMRQIYNFTLKRRPSEGWPIEPRYVEFQWEILKQMLLLSGKDEISFRYFWPDGKRHAFVLTHDIETAEGQRLVPIMADMEETLGFHSLFNFVPELYPLDWGLIEELQDRGFEIGVHGLKHDCRLFNKFERFTFCSEKINKYFQRLNARAFRAPLTIRNPEWMQLLDMEYDLSFFDTDPYEPLAGGVMSIWPFTIGRFLELPYTLPQDCTLYQVFGETTPRIWFQKMDFIENYHGMALGIVHPDYSSKGKAKEIYRAFLVGMMERGGYWHALPHEVASWWSQRGENSKDIDDDNRNYARAILAEDKGSIWISTTTGDVLTNLRKKQQI